MATPKPGVAVLVGRATGAPRGTNVRTLPWWRAPASWGGFARRFSARSFGRARSLAGGHDFGLAVVLVALAAGMALSVTVDALVLAVKGIAPAGFASRLLINALLLGARMTITVAALALVGYAGVRVTRSGELALDRAFTAIAFALSPLVLAPLAAAIAM